MAELLYGACNLLVYFAVAVAVVLLLRRFVQMPDELFRKILHFVLLGSLTVWTLSFPTWWIEVLSLLGFVVLVYPILLFFEHFQAYSKTVTERKKGELKQSLVLVFFMFALVVTVTEGIFDDPYLALCSVYAWGVGDAFAALVGKKWGKHKIVGGKEFRGDFGDVCLLLFVCGRCACATGRPGLGCVVACFRCDGCCICPVRTVHQGRF